MDQNSIYLNADIKKYQGRVLCEGILFLIIYIIPAIVIFCTAGMEGIEGFTGLFFIYPVLGCLALEALQENDLIKLKRYKNALRITFWVAGILGSISSLIAIYFLINVLNFECTNEVHDTCEAYIAMQTLMLIIFGAVAAISIFTFIIAHISYKHSSILLDLLPQLQLNSQQYIPMQSLP